jgi:hypothetical protein
VPALARPLLLSALLAAAAGGGQPPEGPVQLRDVKLPVGVNRQWLQADCNLFWNVRRALPPDPSRPGLATLPENTSTLENIDLGFGITRHNQRSGGGYFSCDVVSVTHERALVSLQVKCWGSGDKLAQTRPIIERALGPAFARAPSPYVDMTYRTAYDFPEARRRARAALDQRLGLLAPVTVPSTLASGYATLMSAEEALAVGTYCSEGGEPPPGAREMKALRAAGRLDLIRNVLRGPNPEARIYALATLKELGAVDAQDRAVIDRIMALPIKIESCEGCDFASGTIKDALEALK